MSRRHNVVEEPELLLFRADPRREQALGITDYVVCRECGRCGSAIKHLRRHGLSKEEYRAKWAEAPTVSPAERNLRKEAGKRRWADPARRAEQANMMTSVWANLSEQGRKKWIENSTAALQTDEVKKRISEGTKTGLADPEARKRLSAGLKQSWASDFERHDRARETAITNFTDPEVVARRKAGFAKAETREKIGVASKCNWDGNEQRRLATQRMMLERWAKIGKGAKFIAGRQANEAVRIFAKELHKNRPELSLPQLGVKMGKKFCRKFSKSLVAYYLNT